MQINVSELPALSADEDGGIGGSGVIGGVEGSLPYVERPCEMLVISWGEEEKGPRCPSALPYLSSRTCGQTMSSGEEQICMNCMIFLVLFLYGIGVNAD